MLLQNCFRWFFESYKGSITPTKVIVWWEKRRLGFNMLVLLYGAISLIVLFWAITTSGHLEPGEDAIEPMVLLILPIAVNICYTLGWFIELIFRFFKSDLSPKFSPILLKIGIGFSFFILSIPSIGWLIVRLTM